MHICTNINYIHNLFSMSSLISKINRKKCALLPLFTAKDFHSKFLSHFAPQSMR